MVIAFQSGVSLILLVALAHALTRRVEPLVREPLPQHGRPKAEQALAAGLIDYARASTAARPTACDVPRRRVAGQVDLAQMRGLR